MASKKNQNQGAAGSENVGGAPEAPAPSTPPEVDQTIDAQAVELTSDKPGDYPGLGLEVLPIGRYSMNDAARILTAGVATCSPEDRDRLVAAGLLVAPRA